LVTEAIGGERIAVEDECCDSRGGFGLRTRAFCGWVVVSLSWKAGVGVLTMYVPRFLTSEADGNPGSQNARRMGIAALGCFSLSVG
jgi:hypothetical protein